MIDNDVCFFGLQELPKLLRGYHKCSPEEAAQLAAYIFRIKYKDDKSKLQSLTYVHDTFLPLSKLSG